MSGLIYLLWLIVAVAGLAFAGLAVGAVCAWFQDFKESAFVARFLS